MSKKRILYVEDYPELRQLIPLVLTDYEVVPALGMMDGLDLAHDEKFDLYLIDYYLPDGTGFDLTLSIRNFDPQTPILFLSGESSLTEQQIINLGANGLVEKGSDFFVHELSSKISQMLSAI